ncbi:MAG: lipid-A-disaccharide synthase N-terminal domain-containing protein [Phycisphaerales bacterium]|nr:lipid-A-disaccharide synthase N-terminal domain-containing protein [Phycisphaerales bacterium]
MSSDHPKPRARVKWEPWALMVAMLALGVWLVWSPISGLKNPSPRAGAAKVELRVGTARGIVEVIPGPTRDQSRFKVLLRDGHESGEFSSAQFIEMYGRSAFDAAVGDTENPLFRVLNITSWGALIWVGVGFVGQLAFTGRTLVQWIVSEAKRESVVPELFWWLSLAGGVMLFTYFVWRQDFVGVLGQSSGVVIYARNLRLIYKRRRQPVAG